MVYDPVHGSSPGEIVFRHMSVVQRGVRSLLPPPQPETAWVMSHPLMAYNETGRRITQAPRSHRTCVFRPEQLGGGGRRNAHPRPSCGGLQEIVMLTLIEETGPRIGRSKIEATPVERHQDARAFVGCCLGLLVAVKCEFCVK